MRKILILILLFSSSCPAVLLGNENDEFHQVLHRSVSNDGSVTAIWIGKDPGELSGNFNPPLSYGVKKLLFKFSKDDQAFEFKPKGSLYFDCWSFDIFDEDGRYVVLLQDHYGPYHVVKIEDLMDYLKGKKPPYEVVDGQDPDNSRGVVHGRPDWISGDTFRFTVACCGSKSVVTHKIGSITKRGKWKRVY